MDDSLQRKMMGFPFEKYDKSNLGGTGVAWVRAGRKKRGYFRECRLWFSMLRCRAQTCSIFETWMGTAGTENLCVAKTMLTLAASKCLRGGEREEWVACYCQPIVCSQPQPLLLCPRWPGPELPKGRLKTKERVWENVSNTLWKFKTSTYYMVSDKLNFRSACL